MRHWFNSISLRWKLASVTVLATVIALLISGMIMAIYDARTYEREKVDAISSEAEILAASVAAALVFNDPKAAQEYLTALNANSEIMGAAVYDDAGKLVTSYTRPGVQAEVIPQVARAMGAHFEGGELSVFAPVADDETIVGSIYLRASVEPVGARLARYIAVLLAIGAGALGLALPLSLWLHRLISNPIEELAARNSIIKTMLDSVDHGVVIVDADRKIAFTNDRLSQLLGLEAEATTDGADFEILTSDIQRRLAIQQSGSLDQVSQSGRDQYALKDGRTIECRQAPLPRGGFVRTYTDISEEKLLQDRLQQAKVKAEEAAVAKSQFLAAMSHEIRTPMSGVIGIVELLRSTQLTEEQRQMVDLIQRSGIGLLDVINDILDYSKIEAGRMTVERTEFALADVVESTAEVIGGHTQSKTLNIICTVDPKIDATVKGDPVRIRQIILSLMGNVVKFTSTGTVSIEVIAKKITDQEIVALFEVTDTGLGIPEDKQRQLFQPFSQADFSTTRKYGGTGLGLSISKNLIELMGGEIGVRSVVGRGSTFWFTVPFERLPMAERSNSLEGYDGVLTDLRIVMCDPGGSRSACALYARAAGIEVLESTSHADALATWKREMAHSRPVHAVIVSVRIGDGDFSRFIRDLNALQSDIKTVVIAPHLSGSAAKVAMDQKPSAVLSAPVRRVKFYDAIATATGRTLKRRSEAKDFSKLNFQAPSTDVAMNHGCLILVAEDNQTNQFVIRNQMRRLGLAAEFVNDGREAWDVISKNEGRHGLLITDCHMPFIDGYQLTGLIRDRELTSKRHLPIVALTANALQGEADICRAAGMDGYMFKPTDLATLDEMVQRWLPQTATLRRALADIVQTDISMPPSAAAVDGNGAVPIDTSILAGLLGNSDPSALREMLQFYLSTEKETPETLRALIRSRDGDGLAKAAHAAKGAAVSAGAARLADLYKTIEASAALADWPTIEGLSPQVDIAFADVRGFIEAF